MASDTSGSGSGAGTALAFLLGVGAGIAAGLLFAPQGGRETRERLRGKAQEARAKMREGIEKEKNMVSDAIDSAKQAAQESKETLS